jgi:hypothetical protein
VLLLLASATVVGGVAAAGPVGPGGKIGTMTLTRGVLFDADISLWNVCNGEISKFGRYHRSCAIPRLRRTYIGRGARAPTEKALAEEWKRQRWSLSVDGRAVNLAAFGTNDSSPPSRGKPAVGRFWKVILVGATAGKHTVRYRTRYFPAGTIDATWTVTVEK